MGVCKIRQMAARWCGQNVIAGLATGRIRGGAVECPETDVAELFIIFLLRMMSDKKTYDADLHARNQQKHGSLILKFLPVASTKAGE